jgi:hypothetical protein
MEKTSDGKETCVETCPVGSVADLKSGRCQCPEFSQERHMNGKRFCECPAHAQWVATENKCQCATGSNKILTHKGCVEDKSEECWKKPFSYYESGDNSCVTVSNCANAGAVKNCKRCETRQYYTAGQAAMPMKCTECATGFKQMGMYCIPHDAPKRACTIIVNNKDQVPAHLEGCKSCYNAAHNTDQTDLVCDGYCEGGYYFEGHTGKCMKTGTS